MVNYYKQECAAYRALVNRIPWIFVCHKIAQRISCVLTEKQPATAHHPCPGPAFLLQVGADREHEPTVQRLEALLPSDQQRSIQVHSGTHGPCLLTDIQPTGDHQQLCQDPHLLVLKHSTSFRTGTSDIPPKYLCFRRMKHTISQWSKFEEFPLLFQVN